MGFEVQEEKREGPMTCLPILGIEVDLVAWELRVSKKKLQALSAELQTWANRSATTKREIASLHGQLSFVAQVAKPGWIFLQCMVEEMQKATGMDESISLSADFLSEVRWWRDLLPEWNGVSLIPDQQWTSNADFNLWTDASGMGFGAYWDGDYLMGKFSDWT